MVGRDLLCAFVRLVSAHFHLVGRVAAPPIEFIVATVLSGISKPRLYFSDTIARSKSPRSCVAQPGLALLHVGRIESRAMLRSSGVAVACLRVAWTRFNYRDVLREMPLRSRNTILWSIIRAEIGGVQDQGSAWICFKRRLWRYVEGYFFGREGGEWSFSDESWEHNQLQRQL